mmetsp:Transcript_28172/g.87421  ORF Transcript_28172/g.87421 Transcript_28172/m.87421 type:complete len:83 (-) Transcript_28172:7-255(-)
MPPDAGVQAAPALFTMFGSDRTTTVDDRTACDGAKAVADPSIKANASFAIVVRAAERCDARDDSCSVVFAAVALELYVAAHG